MNKNGRIDAEDFKILRSTMNGAWRNEHKHVNHSEKDKRGNYYEKNYARKYNPSRTGYKGRKEYGGGGGVEDNYNGKKDEIIAKLKAMKGGLDNKPPKVYERNGYIYVSAENGDNYADYNNLMFIDEQLENLADSYDTYWDWENAGAIVLSPIDKYAKGTKLTGKGSRAKNTYNKEVDAYKWFVVSDANDIDSGWEYKSDAQDQANEFNEGDGYQGKKWKVMSLVTLKKKNLADPRENWKYKAEFGALLLGAGVGAVLGNEIAKSGIKGTASKIQSRIKDDYADFKQASQKKKIDKFETGGKPKVVPYKDLSKIKPDFVNDVKKKVAVPEITLKKTGEVIEFEGLNKRIQSSLDVDKMLRKMWNTDLMGVQEEAYVIFLNQANKPIGYYHHSTGAINLTVMDVEIVSAMAIKSLSKGVIIAHNHPSGEKKPSSADVSMTKNMKTALGLFNIDLVDHMIITKDGYFSFLDNGIL
jgi:DNA repair protein RadC